MNAEEFVTRWSTSGGAELANSQPFLIQFCQLLDVPLPDPTQADESLNRYVFEKAVTFNNGDGTTSSGRVDLYRAGCFVLESKQGSERRAAEQALALATVSKQKKFRTGTADRNTAGWEQAMVKARKQAEGYAKALPEWPPFLIVVDVGHCIDLYADFSGTGKLYQPFPDPKNYRIRLQELADPEHGESLRQTLHTIWLDPLSLDPSRRAAKVTRDLAARLAKLAKSLEEQTDVAGIRRHSPEDVAQFLMRCLFTMFAEDVGLIPKASFATLLESLRATPDGFAPTVEALWRDMDAGCAFSPILRAQVKRFNGGLFEEQAALPLNSDQLELLIEASKAQWNDVEPAIFGTLLERALDPHERHKLGAHYTPRAYVERLVMPTIIEPLREQWDETYAAAVLLNSQGKSADAIKAIQEFHEQLCETRVLDPACGSGNFLYVALELMKRLEGEVLNALREFGDRQLPLHTIDPHQFLGIEVNPRAAAITDLVLWIGYLQWHFRTRGNAPLNEPIIRKFHNIECRDAVLAWDAVEPVTDDEGNPVTRWDGRTTKPHLVTGEEVPDETARVQELRYANPRKATWPATDFIVGNPPFIGNKRMRLQLGDGYVESLRSAYEASVPNTADYVMYWWSQAATLTRESELQRFGLISTNSITQIFNRQVVQDAGVTIRFAIPDHPWVDTAGGAAVRVAMAVCDSTRNGLGVLVEIEKESAVNGEETNVTYVERTGIINPDFTTGVNLTGVARLEANCGLSFMGMIPLGAGFWIKANDARELGVGADERFRLHVKRYLNGRDLMDRPRHILALDFYGLSEHDVRTLFPRAYQWILERVKPQRDQDNRESRRRNWWIFAESVPKFRNAAMGLSRYIGTAETSKHRIFQFIASDILPDQKIRVIASDNSSILGVLSSRVHVVWSNAVGGRLGKGNDPVYNNTKCFEPFPFPDLDGPRNQRIRIPADQLDTHRKRQQELHPDLTTTGMYNVLEKLRSGEPLTTKERKIHDDGLVSVLKQIHDDLDAAVFDAYGWPHDLTDEQILERLVALNHERAEEESRGIVRWLRPDFQNPAGKTQTQLDRPEESEDDDTTATAPTKTVKPKKEPWPKSLPERIRAIRAALAMHAGPAVADDMAKRFSRSKKAEIAELLETLVEVGQARRTDDGRYVA